MASIASQKLELMSLDSPTRKVVTTAVESLGIAESETEAMDVGAVSSGTNVGVGAHVPVTADHPA
jgi:hypothetical protein